jgi:hypothetical protein
MVPCEQHLYKGESILRDRETPYQSSSIQFRTALSKGKQVKIPARERGYCAATQRKEETSAGALGRVIFSF